MYKIYTENASGIKYGRDRQTRIKRTEITRYIKRCGIARIIYTEIHHWYKIQIRQPVDQGKISADQQQKKYKKMLAKPFDIC